VKLARDRRSHARDRRGFALLAAVAMAMLTLAAWAVAYRAMQDAIRTETFFLERDHRDTTVTRALAIGVGLLRTGSPPADPYACIVDMPDGSGHRECTVTFASLGASTWQVDARPSTATEIASLPPAPDHFD
jgi:hypothetical protein